MQSLFQITSRVALLRSQPMIAMRCAQFAAPTKKSEKSLGDEKNYINKNEQQLLKNLLKKVKEQATKSSLTEEKLTEVCDKEIRELCAKHGVTPDDSLIKDLLAWKLEQ